MKKKLSSTSENSAKLIKTALFLAILIFSACDNYTSTEALYKGSFLDDPLITIISPEDQAVDIATNSPIIIHSTQKVDFDVLEEYITITDSTGTPADFAITERVDRIYNITPLAEFLEAETYTIEVRAGLYSQTGKSVLTTLTSSFTTADQTNPLIASENISTPKDEGTTTFTASITFNEPVTGVALSAGSVDIITAKGCVKSVSMANLSGTGAGPYTFNINGLMDGAEYTVTLGNDIKDVTGNPIPVHNLSLKIKPVITLAKNIGGQGTLKTGDYSAAFVGSATTADADGNMYVATAFKGTANFGTVSITSGGTADDVAVIKMNSTGQVQWVKQLSTIGSFTGTVTIESMASGNGAVYLAINSYHSGAAATLFGSSVNGRAMLIIKLNTGDGSRAWTGVLDAPFNDSLMSLAVFGNTIFGYMGVSGALNINVFYNGTTSVSPTQFSGLIAGAQYIFALTDNGTDVSNKYIRKITTENAASIESWAVDTDGALYFSGTTHADKKILDIDTTNVDGTYPDGSVCEAIFIEKLDSGGNFLFNRLVGKFSVSSANALVYDSGYLYIGGTILGTATVAGESGSIALGEAGKYSSFIGKIKADNLEDLSWAKSFGTGKIMGGCRLYLVNGNLNMVSIDDLTEYNIAHDMFGRGLLGHNGLSELLWTRFGTDGTFKSARHFGGVYDDLVHRESPFFMTSTGKLGFVSTMQGNITIGNTTLLPSGNSPDVIFWTME